MDTKKSRNPIGYTDLLGARGVSKSDLRIRLLGSIDEASAALSVTKAFLPLEEDRVVLTNCQQDLSQLMGFIAQLGTEREAPEESDFFAEKLTNLESVLQSLKEQVVMPARFIFPGENKATGVLDFARATIRRVERELNAGFDALQVEALNARQYLNRLSTLCYLLILKHLDQDPA